MGRYTILSKFGEGGMAEVFLGELRGTKGFKKRVVVKMLKAKHLGDPHQVAMFADEARMGSRFAHPHIPSVLELGEHQGRPFMVQEYVEGPSLSALMIRQRENGRLAIRLVARVVLDVAKALHYAHALTDEEGNALKVIHRDVSMSNILIGAGGVSKLIDFGVARYEQREAQTEGDLLKGKLRYLAPETLGRGEVSHQSDIYALGVVLYTVTTGRAPWRNADEVGLRMTGDYARPTSLLANFPEDLEEIIDKSLAVEPADRYQSGGELAIALERWLKAHGGSVSNSFVAKHVASLFPRGAADWSPEFNVDRSTMGTGTYDIPSRYGGSWVAALLAVGVVFVLGVGLLTTIVAANAVWSEPVAVVPDPREQARSDFLILLGLGEEAMQAGDATQAGRHARAMERLEVSDAVLLTRYQALTDWVAVEVALEGFRARMETELDEVFSEASGLASTHTDHQGLLDFVAELQELRKAAAEKEVVVAPPPTRPKPAPVAKEPSMLSVDGSPAGAEVIVDGRFVGTVPLQLVVDPGPHDVALRMEGYVQRRKNIEANGKPLSVRLELPHQQ